jgi:DNA modification methylase
VLRGMADNSIDSIVTDPPYGLTANKKGGTGVASVTLENPYGRARISVGNGAGGFMGMKWDSDVPPVEVWAECLRVLKPGGYLLAFAGTRTQHRMAVRIEDAGFEIRDMIAWVYGSGFPKSLNVAKAVDEKRKPDTRHQLLPNEAKFCTWMREQSGLDTETVRRVTGSARFMTGEVEIVNTATKDAPRYGRRAMVPTAESWARLREHMTTQPPDWVEALVKEPPQPPDETPGEAWTKGKGLGTTGSNEWQGWGTALKPALEPITVARKPLVGTVAANVLAHGTGALNIDGCRVLGEAMQPNTGAGGLPRRNVDEQRGPGLVSQPHELGRWPANLIHDGSEEVLAAFPQAKGQQGAPSGMEPSSKTANTFGDFASRLPAQPRGDTGNAARFFYCAKASKADRNEGCEHIAAKQYSHDGRETPIDNAYQRNSSSSNHHPTVKPTDLMAYLCRLVTPPGGVVLDPFMGSGSTGKAAIREGFQFIGIEREDAYIEIARVRIASEFERANQAERLRQPSLNLEAA